MNYETDETDSEKSCSFFIDAEPVSPKEIRLSWNSLPAECDSLIIESKKIPDYTFTELDTVSRDSEYYYDDSLDADTTYQYRILAVSRNEVVASNGTFTKTFDYIKPPSNPVIESVEHNSIKILWKDNSSNEKGFIIQRKKLDDPYFITIGRTQKNIISFCDRTVCPGTEYTFRIAAYNNTTQSGYSSKINIRTNDFINPPKEVSASQESSDTIKIKWKDSSDNENGYIISRKKSDSDNFIYLTQTSPGAETYFDTGLITGEKYFYSVTAVNSETESEPVITDSVISEWGVEYISEKKDNKAQNCTCVAISGDGKTAVCGYSADNRNSSQTLPDKISIHEWDSSKEKWIITEITPYSNSSYDNFGCSVAISNDGNTIAVGSYGFNESAPCQGRVYIYEKAGKNWNGMQPDTPGKQPAVLKSGNDQSGLFGFSVALSSDGMRLAASAPEEAVNNETVRIENTGAVYIFDKTGKSWNSKKSKKPADKLQPSDSSEYQIRGLFFGESVAISKNGKTIAVSSVHSDNYTGAVYIYTESKKDNKIHENKKITASDGYFGECFGKTVSISGDGKTVAAGCPGESSRKGAVYIYETDDTWDTVSEIKITSTGAMEDEYFGFCTLSADSSFLVVGSILDESEKGSIHVFKRNGSSWDTNACMYNETVITSGYTLPGSTPGIAVAVADSKKRIVTALKGRIHIFDNFTSYPDYSEISSKLPHADIRIKNASLSASGNLFVLSDPDYNNETGLVLINRYISDELISTELSETCLNSGDRFGSDVAVSSNEQVIAVGSDGFINKKGLRTGAVFLYCKNDNSSNYQLSEIITPHNGSDDDLFGNKISISDSGDIIAVSSPLFDVKMNGKSIKNSGSVYILKKQNKKWNQFKKIASDLYSELRFGTMTKISGDGSTIAVMAFPGKHIYVYDTINSSGETIIHIPDNRMKFENTLSISGAGDYIYSASESGKDNNEYDILVFSGTFWDTCNEISSVFTKNEDAHEIKLAVSSAGNIIVASNGSGCVNLFCGNGKNWTPDNPLSFNNMNNYKIDFIDMSPDAMRCIAGLSDKEGNHLMYLTKRKVKYYDRIK